MMVIGTRFRYVPEMGVYLQDDDGTYIFDGERIVPGAHSAVTTAETERCPFCGQELRGFTCHARKILSTMADYTVPESLRRNATMSVNAEMIAQRERD